MSSDSSPRNGQRRVREGIARWPALMDVPTAAEYLSIGITSVNALLASKEIKARTIGKLIRIEQTELDRFIDDLPGKLPIEKRCPIGTRKILEKARN